MTKQKNMDVGDGLWSDHQSTKSDKQGRCSEPMFRKVCPPGNRSRRAWAIALITVALVSLQTLALGCAYYIGLGHGSTGYKEGMDKLLAEVTGYRVKWRKGQEPETDIEDWLDANCATDAVYAFHPSGYDVACGNSTTSLDYDFEPVTSRPGLDTLSLLRASSGPEDADERRLDYYDYQRVYVKFYATEASFWIQGGAGMPYTKYYVNQWRDMDAGSGGWVYVRPTSQDMTTTTRFTARVCTQNINSINQINQISISGFTVTGSGATEIVVKSYNGGWNPGDFYYIKYPCSYSSAHTWGSGTVNGWKCIHTAQVGWSNYAMQTDIDTSGSCSDW